LISQYYSFAFFSLSNIAFSLRFKSEYSSVVQMAVAQCPGGLIWFVIRSRTGETPATHWNLRRLSFNLLLLFVS
jgi:hypothetical protein